ncbi:MAG: hypothetical protein C0434_08090 [Xanthomonadaceae bacterium]|nr:hypothetical protein [Xanthomonadaceae bacterium]
MAKLPNSLTLMSAPASQLLSLGGVELNSSRRFLDFEGISTVRVQFKGTLLVRVEYSLDFGATWGTLVAEDTYEGANPYIGGWQQRPAEIGNWGDVLLRAIGIGSGLLTTVDYVELQYR